MKPPCGVEEKLYLYSSLTWQGAIYDVIMSFRDFLITDTVIPSFSSCLTCSEERTQTRLWCQKATDLPQIFCDWGNTGISLEGAKRTDVLSVCTLEHGNVIERNESMCQWVERAMVNFDALECWWNPYKWAAQQTSPGDKCLIEKATLPSGVWNTKQHLTHRA